MHAHTALQAFRSSKWFKPALGLAGLIIIVCLALLILPRLIDINTYRGTLAGQLEQRLGRTVKLGTLSLSLLPTVRVQVEDFAIGDDTSFAQGDFLKAQTVRLQLRLAALLRGEFEVVDIDLNEPQVTVIQAGADKWNWSTLKPLQSSATEAAPPPFNLRLREGSVKLINRAVTPATEETFEHVNLMLTDFSPRQPFAFTLTLQSADAKLEADGKLAPKPAEADKKPTWQGQITKLSLQSPQLKKPLEVAAADFSFASDSCRVDNLRAQFNQSQLTGWLEVRNFDQPAATFDLKADQLLVAEWQTALAKSGGKASPANKRSLLRAEGQIAIGKLVLNHLIGSNAHGKAVWQHDTLTLDPFSVKLYSGTYQGAVRIELNGNAPELALQGRYNEIDINQFLSATGRPSSIHGRGAGALNLRGQGTGDALTRSLVGTGSLAILNGKFTGFDLSKQVGVLGKLQRLPGGGGSTPFQSLKTNLKFDRGRLGTSDLELLMDEVRVNGDGALQLGEPPTMDYTLLAHLSASLSKLAVPNLPGKDNPLAQVTGILGAAGNIAAQTGTFFFDQAGLAVPLKMSGPIDNPNVSLNNVVLQQRAATQLKDRVVNPAAQKPAETIKGVMDLFKSKKK
jgi:AsmA protein